MNKLSSSHLSIQSLSDHLRLARTEGVGANRYHQLLKHYKSAAAALEALPTLRRGKDPNKKFVIPPISSIMKEIEKTFEYSGQFLIHGYMDYPPLLSQLNDAPPVLTVLGNPDLLHKPNVAIVGARNASIHGIKIAENLAADLSSHKIGIISGLARGIDQAAHKGALYTGFTIAAIACGIDITYPSEHLKLQQEIAQKGVIISEFPFGTAPQAAHFPRRNRLIAGLCHGCVVIEAALNSGSLITSKMALNYHKPIFAVPGSPLDPRCRGSNNLLRMGAVLTENALDVLSELPEFSPNPIHGINNQDLFSTSLITQPDANPSNNFTQPPDNPEDYILSLLSSSPVPIDTLIRDLPYSTPEILGTLTVLEINNKIIFQQNGYILNYK
ncbi:DNA-processing protein DprA [Commensalibacter sp. TBRC 16381]|uniref:DNA-processing protein DprA n=2 Tax=Commensalibacter oyaizuii TaxID=3043873 RepID=A0ABT6Q088_9PROT|nr:DNA-processing protein DprA [Commensalibacter sp. TBRC 16381]MDI2090523.1 DNA-processing protein DprA [Commensalibacter sp. TBRC 16381]